MATDTKICDKKILKTKSLVERALCTYQCQARGGGGRATHGNLTVMYIPREGLLIGHHVPRVGIFGTVDILDNGEGLDMTVDMKEVQLLLFCNFAFFKKKQ